MEPLVEPLATETPARVALPSLSTAFCLWAALGVLHGGHWWYLGGAAGSMTRTRTCRAHTLFIVSCHVLFWIFRQTMLPWYIQCPEAPAMDVRCLFYTQTTAYAAFYVLHVVLLSAMIFHWLLDLAYLPLIHVFDKPMDDNPGDFPFYLHVSEYVIIAIATLILLLVTMYVSGPNHL